jgi:hypothetical protein
MPINTSTHDRSTLCDSTSGCSAGFSNPGTIRYTEPSSLTNTGSIPDLVAHGSTNRCTHKYADRDSFSNTHTHSNTNPFTDTFAYSNQY